MADDSVPLPFPNLKVPTWHYQISAVPRLAGEASTSFWKAVEEDGELLQSTTLTTEMAPYLESIHCDRADLIKSLAEKNAKQLEEYDVKLKEAEENQGDSEISELLRSRAMYYCRIGAMVSGHPAVLS